MLRRDRASRLFIVVVGGLSVGLVCAAWQAERRADDSVQRLISYSGAADELIYSCPQGLDVQADPALLSQCGTPDTARQAAADLKGTADVASVGVGAPVVMALLDPSASNGWGRVTIAYASGAPGLVCGRPIIVAGRLPNDDAPDEVVVTESIARDAGLRVGDTVQLAGWTSSEGRFDVPPDGPAFGSRVVGIIRSVSEISAARANDLTGTTLGDAIYAGPAWSAAHAEGVFSYGWGALLHLRDHQTDAFNDALSKRWTDRFFQSGTIVDADLSALHRSINTERAAIGVFALIGAFSAAAMIVLSLDRQLKRALADADTLVSLGVSKAELRLANVLNALVVGVPTALLAAAVCFALSPFGPLGLARRAEPSLHARFDVTVTFWCVVAVIASSVLVGVTARRRRLPQRETRRSRVQIARDRMGSIPRVGLGLARGGSPRAAVAAVGLAIAATVASAGVVNSFERVEQHPIRYGAWWDLVVGDYSDARALSDGEATVRSDPDVLSAAVYGDLEATIDGRLVDVTSISPLIGTVPSTIISGRAPVSANEIALGTSLADALHVHVGQTVTVTPSDDQAQGSQLTVVGLAVLENPTQLDVGPGDGALVVQGATGSIQDVVGQSILVHFNPSVGQNVGRRNILNLFKAFVSPPTPQSDLTNLARIRSVPWFIAGLMGALAFATLLHAMVTVMRRRRREFAVLSALGMTRRQLRLTAVTAAISLILASAICGLALGVISGRILWFALTRRAGLASAPVVSPWPLVAVSAFALLVAAITAASAQAWSGRRDLSAALRDL